MNMEPHCVELIAKMFLEPTSEPDESAFTHETVSEIAGGDAISFDPRSRPVRPRSGGGNGDHLS
jgi:hypothetical protein